MLSPTQGFTYNKFEKPNDWPDIKKTFDYQIENGKLLGANDYIELKGPVGYTVVGTPTIVDGVVSSNFDNNSYLKLERYDFFSQDSYEYVVKFKAGNQTTQTGSWRYITFPMQRKSDHSEVDWYGQYSYGKNNTLYIFGGFKSDGSQSEGVLTTTAGNTYWLKWHKQNGVQYASYSTDGINYTELCNDGGANNTEIPTSTMYSICLAYSEWEGAELDLNSTYIKVNGALWFGKKYRRTEESNGMVTKSTIPVPEGLKIGNYTVPYNGMYDIISQTLVEDCSFYPINRTDTHFLPVDNNKLVGPVDYTIVGSPSIVDGILSSITSDNYATTTSVCQMNEISQIDIKFSKSDITSTATESVAQFPGLLLMTTEDAFYWIVYKTDGADGLYGPNGILQNNTPIYVRYKVEGADLAFYYSTTGAENSYTLIGKKAWADKLATTSGNIMFGYSNYGWPSAFETGSIDLNHTYIKVNGALWFGKETWQPSIYDTNCMIELVGHTLDYSSYNNYGFTPTVSNGGTYNIWIDNQKVKENIASETATQLSWSDLALTTGYTVTTPSSLKAHVVKIEPSVDTNTLTGNLVTRVSSSGIEPQGRLCQIIGTRDVFSLNRVSSFTSSVTSPVLKSLDSFTGELNSNTLVYSFYDTSLEHIPTIAMNGASSMYDGLWAFQQTKIKYVALKGTNTLKEASKFFDTPTLEKIDSENTLEFNTGDFGNNKKLKMLPKGTFVNSNYSEFLINDSSLLPTDLDLSSSNTITKLDVYGTSDYRIDGLKSLLVSNEAPFTGTSPQINVSYTGLDRDALVDLFNSMPYNVGYTVVGSPTITDGVASNFSDNDYFTISTTFDLSKAWEIVINYDYGTVTPSTMGVLLGGRGHYFQWQILTNGQISYAMDDKDGNTKYGFVEGLTTKENSFFKMMYDPTNKEITCYKGTNGLNWTQEGGANTVDLTGCSCTFDIGSGVNSYGAGFPIVGSVNFNNTRIKINNILWFNGQAATAKSVNITECAGTSDLTNDDKAIVTNKGWTITE